MAGKIRTRLALLVALAALTAVMVPATLALGDNTPVNSDAGIIYLSLGNSPSSDVITYGDDTQSIPTKKNDCTAIDALNPGDANSILVVTELNALSLGEGKDHIGTLGPNDGSGEPCALAAAGAGTNGKNEGISVKVGDAAAPALMNGFSIDIRLKGNGKVVAKTYLTGSTEPIDTFEFTREGPDNAPDSRDNFRWNYTAPSGKEFDEVRFEADTGDFALGGGADIDETEEPVGAGFDSSTNASQFSTVRAFDGRLGCYLDDDSALIGTAGVDSAYGTVVMHAQNLNEDDDSGYEVIDCILKPFDEGSQGTAISFQPVDPAGYSGTSARYTIDATVENQDVTTNSSGQVTSLQAEYDRNGDFDFSDADGLPNCGFQPPTEPGDAGYVDFWSQDDPVDDSILTGGIDTNLGTPLLPVGDDDIACYYYAGADMYIPGEGPAGKGDESWGIYLEFDPGINWR